MSQPSTTTTKPQSVREIALSLPADNHTVVYHNGKAIVVFCRRHPLREAYAAVVNSAINFR